MPRRLSYPTMRTKLCEMGWPCFSPSLKTGNLSADVYAGTPILETATSLSTTPQTITISSSQPAGVDSEELPPKMTLYPSANANHCDPSAFKFLPILGRYVADAFELKAPEEQKLKWAWKPSAEPISKGDGSRGGPPRRRALSSEEQAHL